MPVLRSVRSAIAKAVRRAIGYVTDTIYGAGGFEPSLTADFTEEFYRGPGVSNFTDLITHARAGNATMTDGYGTELLTNGDFATGDTTGWDTDGNPTVSRGVVTIPIDSGTSEYIEQTVSTESGKTYIVTYDYVDADLDSRISRLSVNDGNNGGFTGSQLAEGVSLNNSNGKVEGVFTAASSNSTVRIINSTSTNGSFTSIDNVSVREMPVIKFAPHNYQRYSDDLSQGAGSTGVTRTATTLTETTSTGEHRIQCGIAPPVVGEKYTMAVEAKSGTGSRNIVFRGYGEGGSEKYPVFDIVNGTVRRTGTAYTDVSITDVGDGYYLCKASVVVSSAFRWAVHMADEAATLGNNAVHNYTGDGSSSVLLRKLRQYRSDLGGMVDNPDNSGNDADFIATSGSAAYLPRIGHHVYNGNAWVNEGVFAESEARTNLYDNNDSMHTNNLQNTTASANGGTAPDGTDDAVKLLETTATAEHTVLFQESVITTGKTYTCSVFVKSIGGRNAKFGFSGINFPSARRVNFDLNAVTTAEPNFSTIQEVGNGWFRLSVTNTSDTTGTRGDTNALLQPVDGTTISYAGDVTKGLLFYGMQIEEGATPSSYIPTANTTTVTRAAESFTIPSANLPWPTPQYIGSELVTNGTFDTDSDWTKGTGWSIADGVATANTTLKTHSLKSVDPYQGANGKTYIVTATFTMLATPNANAGVRINIGGVGENVFIESERSLQAGQTYTISGFGTPTDVSGDFYVEVNSTAHYPMNYTIDNVSVREINPLSVSIAMKGRVSYADENSTSQAIFWQWRDDVNNRLLQVLRTNLGTGELQTNSIQDGTADEVRSDSSRYSPDVLVPFDIASRHGSTFVNGATQGVALTANTTPTALPDLSSTDLNLADDYMGTISEFRVWDRDIGDAGLVEATNPSLEPSLSLTFEGVGTNSFTVSDWSE